MHFFSDNLISYAFFISEFIHSFAVVQHLRRLAFFQQFCGKHARAHAYMNVYVSLSMQYIQLGKHGAKIWNSNFSVNPPYLKAVVESRKLFVAFHARSGWRCIQIERKHHFLQILQQQSDQVQHKCITIEYVLLHFSKLWNPIDPIGKTARAHFFSALSASFSNGIFSRVSTKLLHLGLFASTKNIFLYPLYKFDSDYSALTAIFHSIMYFTILFTVSSSLAKMFLIAFISIRHIIWSIFEIYPPLNCFS